MQLGRHPAAAPASGKEACLQLALQVDKKHPAGTDHTQLAGPPTHLTLNPVSTTSSRLDSVSPAGLGGVGAPAGAGARGLAMWEAGRQAGRQALWVGWRAAGQQGRQQERRAGKAGRQLQAGPRTLEPQVPAMQQVGHCAPAELHPHCARPGSRRREPVKCGAQQIVGLLSGSPLW